MKPSSQSPRTPSRLSVSVHRQLSQYAIAASAAGVGMLVSTQPAEARVVYTPAHKWLPLNQTFYLDLNHDGVKDFGFFLRSSSRFGSSVRSLAVKPHSENAVFGNLDGPYHVASALPKGRYVGRGSPFFLDTNVMFIIGNGDAGSFSFGYWGNVTKQAYLGLKFKIKGKIHYGWARMGHIRDGKPPRAKLTGYAYETVPNKPIITGHSKGPDVITLEPGSLGALAAGSRLRRVSH